MCLPLHNKKILDQSKRVSFRWKGNSSYGSKIVSEYDQSWHICDDMGRTLLES